MKRTAVIPAILLAIFSMGVSASAVAGAGQGQTPPATGQAATTKRPPQAKTQPEYDAWKAAAANTDPAAMEKSAEDFATKYPDSELRVLLYENTMRAYQNVNNAEKTEAMGRKVLTFDGDFPEALVTVAEVIAEKTRDSDIDRDQRLGEASAMAQKALKTVETDISVPAGTPQDKIDTYKSQLRSQAYSILGAIDYKKENYVAAQDDLQKAIDAYPTDPQAVDVLRLALALDKQQKYPEALKVANRAVDMTQDNTPIGTPARRERERLQQLTGGAAPAQPPTPPKN